MNESGVKMGIGLIKKTKKAQSLKTRLAISLVASAIIPLILIGWNSYSIIMQEVHHRTEQSIQSGVEQTRINLENLLDNLDSISKQFAYADEMIRSLSSYMEIQNIFQKYLLQKDIRNKINIISNTNLNIGTIMYIDESNGIIIASNTIVGRFQYDTAPLVYENSNVRYYGPHPSAIRNVNGLVFSIVRKVDAFWLDNAYVYIETNPRVTAQILNASRQTPDVYYLLANDDDYVVWSENEEETGVKLDWQPDGVFQFGESSWRGWRLLAAINAKDYNSLLWAWLIRFIAISTIVLLISMMLAVMVWRMINKPMGVLHKEIAILSNSPHVTAHMKTNTIEFDKLLETFYDMRRNILMLLDEVKAKERAKRELEVEKLLYQINPHFLHNTLNVAQMIALQNGQKDISKIIALLTKLLHYNMGKEGSFVTIREEIDALLLYVELQKIRYEYVFTLQIEVDEDAWDARIPRFILQPLVENALFHGMKHMREEGLIRIHVSHNDPSLTIVVSDNGEGMDASDDEYKQVGMGIGTNYVSKIINVNYEGVGCFDVQNEAGETRFIITIPYMIFS